MTDARAAFLAGERLDDVAIYLADETVDDPDRLLSYGERVDGGLVLVLDGETGRNVFQAATGTAAMDFAGQAMGTEGTIDPDLAGGTCPAAGTDADDAAADSSAAGEDAREATGHRTRFVLAFAEAENQDVGGRYADGDVIHAYAHCECGTSYTQKWIVGER